MDFNAPAYWGEYDDLDVSRGGGGQDPLHKHVRYKEHILWLFEYFGSLEKK